MNKLGTMDVATYVCMHVELCVCITLVPLLDVLLNMHTYDLSILIGCELPSLMQTNFSYGSV